ncbi:MAG: hypothetical protein AVDCRST_MAG95-756 [uncultured Adhaeribacter sp.]|uniref:Neutral/alkaline non-lysosomal ceramidase N-terminal domain-containing protein n=1 Tax=uncultured Adhaeribacter sp. TaxID=448109 RepID=A0A6J4HMP4_9BACT|nr:MAG: hypothetical protein AVDCRST_MAG95-756 [uncultured Adhaeribacter sp.]
MIYKSITYNQKLNIKLPDIRQFFRFTLPLMLFLCQSCLTLKLDDTPYQQTNYYQKTRQGILNYAAPEYTLTRDTVQVGWAKVAITPARPVPMAGYGKRKGKKYTQVRDSVYVRAFVFKLGSRKVAWVTADLLIMPMSVTAKLQQLLPARGYNLANTYLTATHTHYSIGGWGRKPAGRLMAGKYSPVMVKYIADAITQAIERAEATAAPARMAYQQINAPEYVYNRLVGEQGGLDPFIRLLQIQKNSGERALLVTYAAHATSVSSQDLRLSAEYPGALVKALEQRLALNMAAFGAGAVGSHGPRAPDQEYEKVQNLANGLADRIQENIPKGVLAYQTQLQSAYYPLYLPNPQWRAGERRFRPWLFYTVFGKYPAGISALQIGPVVFLGTPCDFSGELLPELTATAARQQQQLIVNSFNGGYIGYVTPEKYFTLKKYETRDMNFFGRYTGTYLQEMMQLIIQRRAVNR